MKSTNRFACLLEENYNSKNIKYIKKEISMENVKDNYFKPKKYNNESNIFKNNSNNLSKFAKAENKIKLDNLCEFPDLNKSKDTASNNNINNSEHITYIDKLNTNLNNKLEEEEIISDGYVQLSLNKSKNIIAKYGKSIYQDQTDNIQYQNNLIMKQLCKNYETWKDKYIYLWGEEEYNKMYKFPNYDYDYFNKLDLKYEEELTKYYEQIRDENIEYDTFSDYDSEY